jgi:hypothetical protein
LRKSKDLRTCTDGEVQCFLIGALIYQGICVMGADELGWEVQLCSDVCQNVSQAFTGNCTADGCECE